MSWFKLIGMIKYCLQIFICLPHKFLIDLKMDTNVISGYKLR